MDNQNNNNESGVEAEKGKPLLPVEIRKNAFVEFIKNNPVLITAIIGLIAVAAMYFWKDIQGRKQKAAVEKMASQQLLQNNHEMLRLLAIPMVWSIRSEMLRGNLEQVNIFTKDLVKEKNFQFIHLVDPGGKIILSTDKKLEGQMAIGMFDPALVQTDSIKIVNTNNEMLTLAVPVMGYDKQLALLIIKYTPVKFISGKN